ncbi:unnamed protein product [Ectocarpus fasciculatus]
MFCNNKTAKYVLKRWKRRRTATVGPTRNNLNRPAVCIRIIFGRPERSKLADDTKISSHRTFTPKTTVSRNLPTSFFVVCVVQRGKTLITSGLFGRERKGQKKKKTIDRLIDTVCKKRTLFSWQAWHYNRALVTTATGERQPRDSGAYYTRTTTYKAKNGRLPASRRHETA